MIAALIDNGSVQPAAHRQLRALAAALSARTSVDVEAVSWKYSDRIPADALGGVPARTLAPWLRTKSRAGERDFVFIPFFVTPQGAIGSLLRREIESLLRGISGARGTFTSGLAGPGLLAHLLARLVRKTIASRGLQQPAVLVVNHGSPSPATAATRDKIASDVRVELAAEIRALAAASLGGARFPHNRPAYPEVFAARGFDQGDVVIAPLFLSPGRHAGPGGDLERGARIARAEHPALNCHFTDLIGTDPQIVELLADGLNKIITPNSRAGLAARASPVTDQSLGLP